MEAANVHNKLILAVVQEDDYDTTVSELNQNGFFVTMLSSTGGFWKKKNITIMLGVEEARLEDALSILKQCAGKRKQTIYSNVTMPTGSQNAEAKHCCYPFLFHFLLLVGHILFFFSLLLGDSFLTVWRTEFCLSKGRFSDCLTDSFSSVCVEKSAGTFT